jgi:hypothetical protein
LLLLFLLRAARIIGAGFPDKPIAGTVPPRPGELRDLQPCDSHLADGGCEARDAQAWAD